MRVISRRTLREYIASKAGHRDQKSLKNALDAWFSQVQKANWKIQTTLNETTHGPASFHRTGLFLMSLTNRYPLVTAVDFEKGIV